MEARTDAISPMELLSLMERGARLTCELLRKPKSNQNKPLHWTRFELNGETIPHGPGRALLDGEEIKVAGIAEGLVWYGVRE